MTVFPAPLVPTVQSRPVLPVPLKAVPDARNGWFVDHPNGRAGHVFPRVVTDLDGDWFGRRGRQAAQPFPGEVQALAYVCGCDPSDIRFEEDQ